MPNVSAVRLVSSLVATALGVLVVVMSLLLLIASVRIVRQYQMGVVERLGVYRRTVTPGLVLIMPFIQVMRLIDMRERPLSLPSFTVIAADGRELSIAVLVYYRVFDVRRVLYEVHELMLSLAGLTEVKFAGMVAQMHSDEALMTRDRLCDALREPLDADTVGWGVHITRLGIRRMFVVASDDGSGVGPKPAVASTDAESSGKGV